MRCGQLALIASNVRRVVIMSRNLRTYGLLGVLTVEGLHAERGLQMKTRLVQSVSVTPLLTYWIGSEAVAP
jgi:hypothetical protein